MTSLFPRVCWWERLRQKTPRFMVFISIHWVRRALIFVESQAPDLIQPRWSNYASEQCRSAVMGFGALSKRAIPTSSRIIGRCSATRSGRLNKTDARHFRVTWFMDGPLPEMASDRSWRQIRWLAPKGMRNQ